MAKKIDIREQQIKLREILIKQQIKLRREHLVAENYSFKYSLFDNDPRKSKKFKNPSDLIFHIILEKPTTIIFIADEIPEEITIKPTTLKIILFENEKVIGSKTLKIKDIVPNG